VDVGLGLEGGVEALEEGVDVARPAAGEVGHDAQEFFFFEGNSRCSAFSLIVGSMKNRNKNRNQKHNKKQTTSAGYQKRQHGRN